MSSGPHSLPRDGSPGAPANREFERGGPFARLEHAITRVVRLTRPRLHRPALAGVGGPPLDPAAYATLLWLADRSGCRLTELASLLAVDISTTSRQVHALEHAGLVEGRRDPDDQRVKRLALSADGAELLARARGAREEALGELLGDWAPEDVATLASLLNRLAASLASSADELELEEAT